MAGCEVSGVLINGVEHYNAVVEAYLVEKNGKEWEEKFRRRCQEKLQEQIK